MKSLFTLLIFIIINCTALAQQHLEVKLNRVLPYTLNLPNELTLEYTLCKKIGIEGGIGYEKNYTIYSSYDSIGNYNILEIFKSKQIRYYIQGKYYFFPRTSNDGFFAGFMFYYNYYTFYEKNDQPLAKPNDTKAYGLESGYKWIITPNILLELSAGGLLSIEKRRAQDRLSMIYDTIFRINAKLGYRF
jgi:hypothetical protein